MEDRVSDLEFKLTHVEEDLKTLNGEIVRQQTHIDRLELALARLESRLEAQSEIRNNEIPTDEKPPHY